MDTLQPEATVASEADMRLADDLLETIPRVLHVVRQGTTVGMPGVTLSQLRALLHVERHPGIGLTELADHLMMSLSSTSVLVDRLVKSGHVQRDIDPDERRRIRLQLTTAGVERVAKAHRGLRMRLADRISDLTNDERTSLRTTLATLHRIASDWADTDLWE